MNKAFTFFLWENDPSVNTPLSEEMLNRINNGLDTVDNRVVTMDTTKANKSDLLTAIGDVSLDESTGIITFTKKSGETITIDTKLEKLAINFTYDATAQQLVITLEDGTIQYVDMKALITELEFLNSDTVLFSVTDGKVTASIPNGSITADKLEPNYLASIQLYASQAISSAQTATSAATESKSYAVGGTGSRVGEDTDNAKYYAQLAQSIAGFDMDDLLNGTIVVGKAKDSITTNGVTLYKSFADIDSSLNKQSPILDIISKMAINSRLVVTIYEGSTDVYPNNNGILEIVRTYSSEYAVARFTEKKSENPQIYYKVAQPSNNDITEWLGSLSTKGGTVTGTTNMQRLRITEQLRVANAGGSEGGEIILEPPQENTAFTSDIKLDVFQNAVRIFGTHGGTTKVFNINFDGITGNDTAIHTGNFYIKGTYTGNGDATARTINTGGKGNFLMVISTDTTHPVGYWVSPMGGWYKTGSSVNTSGIMTSEATYINGVLTLTSKTTMNADGATYTYYCIDR